MRNHPILLAVLLVLGGGWSCATSQVRPTDHAGAPSSKARRVEPLTSLRELAATDDVKNVIFLLTDGTGPEAWPLARWFKGQSLAVDGILTGAIRTYGADSIITDSAPGATAYATGYKGSDKGISVGAWNVTIDAAKGKTAPAYVPVATILEGARLSGRAVGLVATSNIQHATPAAFSAHWHHRENYCEIGEQQVYAGLDVVLSGGLRYLLPLGTSDGKREDKENLVDVIASKGFALVQTRDAMSRIHAGKIWGAFASDAMAYDVDRAATAPTQPSLSDMTAKAIELLSGTDRAKKAGFFLFVEGSKVDWAAHANDPSALVSDLLAFDAAVASAIDFAKKDGNTLVIALADHGTGGISIGSAVSDKDYSMTDDDSVLVPLRKAKLTAEGIEALLHEDSSEQAIRAKFAEHWGVTDLSADEVASLQKAINSRDPNKLALNKVAGPMLSRRARVGWTTVGHSGADVFLFSYGPWHLAGLWENIEIGRVMAGAMGFDLADISRRLFVEAEEGFRTAGFQSSLDLRDPANPVLVVQKGALKGELPVSKNVLRVNGKSIELEGVVVRAEKLGKVYVPRQAIEILSSGRF